MKRWEFNDHARAILGCTRIDLPRVEWDINVKRLLSGGWMGRGPINHDEIGGTTVSRQAPPEDVRDGCPGGWYRSRFVDSIRSFLRTRTEHGMRVPNPFFERCTDDLVLQLVLYLEDQQEAFEAWAFGQVIDG